MKIRRKRRIKQVSVCMLAAALLFSSGFSYSVLAEGGTKPTTKLTTEPTTEPITEPMTELTTEPTTEPITEPTTEPSTEPVTEPTTEPDTAVTNVQTLISELPTVEALTAMSAEEQQAAREKLDSVQQAYMALSDEQKAQITGTEIFDKLYKLFENMTAAANVQALIAELPSVEALTAMNAEEQQAVRAKLDAAQQAYLALTDEQKALVTGTDILNSLYEFFNKISNEAPADDDTLTQETLTTEEETEKVNCTCEIACTADSVNTDCPVCNGDSSQCTGTIPEANTVLLNEEPDTAVTDVQKLIDALPTAEKLKAMPSEEQQAVYTQLYEAYDAYEALSDEQKAQITGTEIFDALFAVFNGMVNTLADDFAYSDDFETSTRTYTGGSGDSLSVEAIANTVFNVNSSLNVSGELSISSGSAEFQSGTVYTGSTSIESGGMTVSGGTLNTGSASIERGDMTVSGGTLKSTGDISSKNGNIYIRGGIVEANSLKLSSTWNNASLSISITGGIVNINGEISSSATGANSSSSVTVNGDAVVFAQSIKQQSNGDPAALDVTSFDKGVVFIGNSGNVYGSVSLPDGVVIPHGYTLEIPAGSTLTIPEGVTLTNNGTITGGGTLTINGDVIGSGQQTVSGTVIKKSQTATVPTWDKANTTASKIALSNTVTGQKYLITDTASTPVIENYTWTDGTGGSLTFDKLPDGSSLSGGSTYYVWTYKPGNDYYNASVVSQYVQVTTVPSAPKASDVTINYEDETISFGGTLEVNTSENFDGTPIMNDGSITDYIKDTEQTIYVRVKETDTTAASEATSVTIPARPAAPADAEFTINLSVPDRIQVVMHGTTLESRIKTGTGDYGSWKTSSSIVILHNNIKTSDTYTIQVRKIATDSSFASVPVTKDNCKTVATYEITIPKTVDVGGEAASIEITEENGSFALGTDGQVDVKVKSGLNSDGTLALTRENDPSTTILSQMKVNGTEFTDLTKSVAVFKEPDDEAVPISFDAPSLPTGGTTIPAGTYTGTVTFEISYSEP